jgi:hypothetical protein
MVTVDATPAVVTRVNVNVLALVGAWDVTNPRSPFASVRGVDGRPTPVLIAGVQRKLALQLGDAAQDTFKATADVGSGDDFRTKPP